MKSDLGQVIGIAVGVVAFVVGLVFLAVGATGVVSGLQIFIGLICVVFGGGLAWVSAGFKSR